MSLCDATRRDTTHTTMTCMYVVVTHHIDGNNSLHPIHPRPKRAIMSSTGKNVKACTFNKVWKCLRVAKKKCHGVYAK